MSLVATGFTAAVVLALLAALTAVVVPERTRSAVTGIGTVLTGLAALITGAAAMAGRSFTWEWSEGLPLSGISLQLDALGGIFVAVTGGVAVAAGLYGISYTRHDLNGRGLQAVFPLFVASMVLVPAASSVGTFLLFWEFMALASLLLVLAEHTRRPAVASAGRWYAAMTHLGFITILIGLLVLSAHAGGDSFEALRQAGGDLPSGAANAVFLLTLAGFTSKAGILPLHAWLPRAHPEAPSHVSALMSAAMVNLGVYGIVRLGFDLLSGGPQWWWVLVLALGAVSAVYGILQAVLHTDLKQLLGYSTTENLGLVLIGVGAAGMFVSADQRVLAGVALSAALLHVVGHAAFKTLLFLSAGSVLHGTGTRDLDALGGLRRGMPVTTALFGVAALGASALPLGTAFVSEWLLLQALVHGLPASGTVTAIAMPVAVAAVALTAGLAVAAFVRAFGIGFLARPRSAHAEHAQESPLTMLLGMGLAGLVSVVLAVLPTAVLPSIGAVTGRVLDAPAPVSGAVTLRLTGIVGSLSPLLIAGLLLAGMVAIAAVLRAVPARRSRRSARLWECGGGPLSPRMEYTATSFAEPLQQVFHNVVRPETGVDTDYYEQSPYLVRAMRYRRTVPDWLERRLYQPLLALGASWGRAGRALATGSVHRYLGYGFYTVCGVLILLAVIR